MIYDASGNPVRRRMGFVSSFEQERSGEHCQVELVGFKELPAPCISDEEACQEPEVE